MTKETSGFYSTSSASSSFQRDTRRPNVIVLLLDDCGSDFLNNYSAWQIANLGYPTGPGVDHPTLTEITAVKTAGVRFMNARAFPSCSPTRACILSGRYAFRTGIGAVTMPNSTDPTLPAWEFGINHATDELILQRLVAPPGYRGLVAGKWHLGLPDGGSLPNGIPWQGDAPAAYGNGWGHLALIKDGDPSFDYECTWSNLDRDPRPPTSGGYEPGYYNFYWNSNGTVSQVAGQYHTTYTRERIQSWIAEQQQPWVVYWAACAIHSPFGAFPDNGTGYSGCMPPDGLTRKAYSYYNGLLGTYPIVASTRAAMEALDIELGNLRTAMGEAEWANTVVIVMGDNGTPSAVLDEMLEYEDTRGATIGEPYASMVTSGGDTYFKGSVYESGMRVPLLVKGPMVRSANRDYWGLVDAVDVFSTIREACRAPLTGPIPNNRRIDGISFLPALYDPDWADNAAARWQSFGEIFSPLGEPSNATDTTLGHRRDRMLIQRRSGEGTYKLVRIRSGTSNVDTMYRLADDDLETQDDPMEQSPLPASGSIYTDMATDLQALLATEGNIT